MGVRMQEESCRHAGEAVQIRGVPTRARRQRRPAPLLRGPFSAPTRASGEESSRGDGSAHCRGATPVPKGVSPPGRSGDRRCGDFAAAGAISSAAPRRARGVNGDDDVCVSR
eukprot:gene9884-biopygen3358